MSWFLGKGKEKMLLKYVYEHLWEMFEGMKVLQEPLEKIAFLRSIKIQPRWEAIADNVVGVMNDENKKRNWQLGRWTYFHFARQILNV